MPRESGSAVNTREGEQIIVNGRDETPFPLYDLRMVYAEARYSRSFVIEAEYAPPRAVLGPARYALLSHPAPERVAVTGRVVGENDFWTRLVNSGGPARRPGGAVPGLER